MRFSLFASLAGLLLAPSALTGDMLGVSATGAVYEVDSTTGSASFVGLSGFTALNASTSTPSGQIFATSGFHLLQIDPLSGAGVSVGTITGPNPVNVKGLARRASDGMLFFVNEIAPGQADELWIMDSATQVATLVGSTGFPGLQSLAMNSLGALYAYDVGSAGNNGAGLVSIDPVTGAGTDVAPGDVGNLNLVQYLTFGQSGILYGGRTVLHTLDLATGALTVIGNHGGPADLRGCDFLAAGPGQLGIKYCTPAVPNSTGLPAIITATGSNLVTDNDLTLTAAQLPVNFGYFLTSQTQGLFDPPGSQGTLCLGGAIGRFNALTHIIVGPTGSIAVDLTAFPQPSGLVAVQPGDIWNFQCWYRDFDPGQTSNFTDAVSVGFQ